MSVDKDKTVVQLGDNNTNPFFEHAEFAGTWFQKKMRVKADAFKKRGKTFLTLPFAMQIGDIFDADFSLQRYHIIRFDSFGRLGGQVFEIGRFDGNRISQFDLDALKKGAWLQIKGYFTQKNNDC